MVDYSKWDNIVDSDDDNLEERLAGATSLDEREEIREKLREKRERENKAEREKFKSTESAEAIQSHLKENDMSDDKRAALQAELEGHLDILRGHASREQLMAAATAARGRQVRVKNEASHVNKSREGPSEASMQAVKAVAESPLLRELVTVDPADLVAHERFLTQHPDALSPVHAEALIGCAFEHMQRGRKEEARRCLAHSLVIQNCLKSGCSVQKAFDALRTSDVARGRLDHEVDEALKDMAKTLLEHEVAEAEAVKEFSKDHPSFPAIKRALDALPVTVRNAVMACDINAVRTALGELPPDEAADAIRRCEALGILPSAGGLGSRLWRDVWFIARRSPLFWIVVLLLVGVIAFAIYLRQLGSVEEGVTEEL